MIDQGKDPAKLVKTPYDLKAATRIAIARNLVATQTALEAFEVSRQKALQTISPGAPEKVQTNQELLAKFLDLWAKETAEPVTIDLALIHEDALNLDANPNIPGTVLAGLTPILPIKK